MSEDLDDFAMPQPLSRVVPNPKFGRYPDAAEDHPARAAQVGIVIAWWADVELRLGLVLAEMLQTTAREAIAILNALPNIDTRIKVILAAAEKALPPNEYLLLQAIHRGVIRPAQKARNRLVHWAWGFCEQVPDSICLIDPDYLLERSGHQTSKGSLPAYDYDHVFVYREKDLSDAIRQVQIAANAALDFRSFLFFKRRRESGHDERYQKLASLPQVRKALDRLLEDQKTPPEERE